MKHTFNDGTYFVRITSAKDFPKYCTDKLPNSWQKVLVVDKIDGRRPLHVEPALPAVMPFTAEQINKFNVPGMSDEEKKDIKAWLTKEGTEHLEELNENENFKPVQLAPEDSNVLTVTDFYMKDSIEDEIKTIMEEYRIITDYSIGQDGLHLTMEGPKHSKIEGDPIPWEKVNRMADEDLRPEMLQNMAEGAGKYDAEKALKGYKNDLAMIEDKLIPDIACETDKNYLEVEEGVSDGSIKLPFKENCKADEKFFHEKSEELETGATAENICNIAQDMIDGYQLEHNNAEISREKYDGRDEVYVTLEAPNHGTVQVVYDAKKMKGLDADKLKKAVIGKAAHECYMFNAEEEFEELWSPDFGHHNEFTPLQFADMLKEDEKFFLKTSDAMNSTLVDNDTENETTTEKAKTEEQKFVREYSDVFGSTYTVTESEDSDNAPVHHAEHSAESFSYYVDNPDTTTLNAVACAEPAFDYAIVTDEKTGRTCLVTSCDGTFENEATLKQQAFSKWLKVQEHGIDVDEVPLTSAEDVDKYMKKNYNASPVQAQELTAGPVKKNAPKQSLKQGFDME